MRWFQGIQRTTWFAVSTTAFIFIIFGHTSAQEKGPFKDQREKKSYAIGLDTVRTAKDLSFEVDADKVAEGIKDAYAGKAKLSDVELRSVLDDLNKEARAKRAEKAKNAGEKNRMEGEAFLRENAGKPGIVVLPSGLQYRIVKEGKGRTPVVNDTVLVHYRGAFINGAEFENSFVGKKPLELVVGDKIIPGWAEAILKMKEGSRWLVVLPPALAYGERGNGPIGPNATLMFDIQLISVKKR